MQDDMRALALGFVFFLTIAADGGGCAPANVVGVQDYGTVVGRVLDATTNKPVPGALVSVGSLYTGRSDILGGFTISGVPVGSQVVIARAPGFTSASASITITKNTTTSAGYVRLDPSLPYGASPAPTLAPPPTPSPSPSPSPTPSTQPSPSVN